MVGSMLGVGPGRSRSSRSVPLVEGGGVASELVDARIRRLQKLDPHSTLSSTVRQAVSTIGQLHRADVVGPQLWTALPVSTELPWSTIRPSPGDSGGLLPFTPEAVTPAQPQRPLVDEARYPLLAALLRTRRLGEGLPSPAQRKLRVVDQSEELVERDQVAFGRLGDPPASLRRRPRHPDAV